jgi:uncharacterized protein YjiS (DUF1127 family)
MLKRIAIFFRMTKEHRRARANLKELQVLNDYELNDIGITRGDISYLSYQPVRDMISKQSYDPCKHYLRGKSSAIWKGKSHA